MFLHTRGEERCVTTLKAAVEQTNFRSANFTSEVIFSNAIVRVASSTKACKLTE